jgi:hypothetical protein
MTFHPTNGSATGGTRRSADRAGTLAGAPVAGEVRVGGRAELAAYEQRVARLDHAKRQAEHELERHLLRTSLSSDEAAAALGVSVRLVRAMAAEGAAAVVGPNGHTHVFGLPAFRYRGAWRFPLDQIAALGGRAVVADEAPF